MAGRGNPKTGGRQKGTPNKVTGAMRDEITASGETPLAYMVRIMRDEGAPTDRRDRMAIAAAPYLHARLAVSRVRAWRSQTSA